jgi:hypothetical protein
MAKPISIFLIIVSLGGLAFGSDWKREVNGRWGFALTYPASLIPEPVPLTALAGAITQRITQSLSRLWVALHIPKSFWTIFGRKN